MSVLTTNDKERVFSQVLRQFGFVPPYGGSASLTVIHQAFMLMKSELDRLDADDEDQGAFVGAIERAIDKTSDRVKVGGVTQERETKLMAQLEAVRDVLRSAFSGLPRTTVVDSVECNFLSPVRFDG